METRKAIRRSAFGLRLTRCDAPNDDDLVSRRLLDVAVEAVQTSVQARDAHAQTGAHAVHRRHDRQHVNRIANPPVDFVA